jgi:hypothetical protein
MTVYNTNDNTKGGRGQGIYTWNGTWIYSGGAPKADTLVNRIIITSPYNVSTMKAGGTLKLTDSILPANASNKKLAWSVLWSGSLEAGKATVDDTGLVTAIKPGGITVRASAIDGSTAYRDFVLTVLPTSTATGISITSETGQYSVDISRTLQLIAVVEPETAYSTVSWEVNEGSEYATVDRFGTVTGNAAGKANIRATTSNKLISEIAVDVTTRRISNDTVRRQIGSGEYLTLSYNGTVWMIENSKEGTPAYTQYDTVPGERYYYALSKAESACPAPWSLPTRVQIEELYAHIQTFASEDEAEAFWFNGMHGGLQGVWHNLNTRMCLWAKESGYYVWWARNYYHLNYNPGMTHFLSVRCVADPAAL